MLHSTTADEIVVSTDVELQHMTTPTTTTTTSTTVADDIGANGLKYLPKWPPVNIDFQDVTYSVPDLGGESLDESDKCGVLLRRTRAGSAVTHAAYRIHSSIASACAYCNDTTWQLQLCVHMRSGVGNK